MSEEYRGNGRYQYMTEEALEALIAGVEDHGMLNPPVYLKELIMEEVEKSIKPAGKNGIDRKTARRQLMVYSMKIIGAAAAAIFCLTMVPMDIGGRMAEAEERRMEKVIEEDVARYREESERILNEPVVREEGFEGLWQNMFGKEETGAAASIWKGMTGWFEMEERDYE